MRGRRGRKEQEIAVILCQWEKKLLHGAFLTKKKKTFQATFLVVSRNKGLKKTHRNYAEIVLLSCPYIQFLYIKVMDNQEDSGATPLYPFYTYCKSLCIKACVPSRLQGWCSFGAPVCIFSTSYLHPCLQPISYTTKVNVTRLCVCPPLITWRRDFRISLGLPLPIKR